MSTSPRKEKQQKSVASDMSVGVKTFRGKRLREARLARGLFKNALADMVGVTGWAITLYEEDRDKPQCDRLETLAKALNFPLAFFSKPEWEEPLSLVFWRSRASESKYVREMTEQRMIWLCEIFSFLEGEVNFPSLEIPELDLPADFRMFTSETIERAAEEIRGIWKLGDRPIADVTLALENAGIPVVNLEILSDKQDGFCFKSETLRRVFVGVNTHNVSAVRARYDAAHELGHAILHRQITLAQAREPSSHKRMEQQAHRFASAFIFPRNSFRDEVYSPTLDYFCALKQKWGLSIASMVYRAADLGLIEDEEKQVLYRNMTRRRWRGALQEPFDKSMPLEEPRMLKRGVIAVLENGEFSAAELASAIAIPERELEQLSGLRVGYLADSSGSPTVGLKTIDLGSGNVVEFASFKKK